MSVLVEHKLRRDFDIWTCQCGAYWDIQDEELAREHEQNAEPVVFYTIEELEE